MQFLIKLKLDLSALSALRCSPLPFVTLYFSAFLYTDILIIFFLIATKDSLFSFKVL